MKEPAKSQMLKLQPCIALALPACHGQDCAEQGDEARFQRKPTPKHGRRVSGSLVFKA